MFGWLKNLFGAQQETKPTLEVYTPPRAQTQQKTTAKKSAAAKSANTGRKQGAKKAGVTKTDLSKMSKDQLETFAKKEFKVDIDKRKKKADLVEEVLKLARKNA